MKSTSSIWQVTNSLKFEIKEVCSFIKIDKGMLILALFLKFELESVKYELWIDYKKHNIFYNT